MNTMVLLWTGTIPSWPLAVPHYALIVGINYVLLALSVAGLWLGRERPACLPNPVPAGSEDRLAA
jgi:hypothetical protein